MKKVFAIILAVLFALTTMSACAKNESPRGIKTYCLKDFILNITEASSKTPEITAVEITRPKTQGDRAVVATNLTAGEISEFSEMLGNIEFYFADEIFKTTDGIQIKITLRNPTNNIVSYFYVSRQGISKISDETKLLSAVVCMSNDGYQKILDKFI